MQAHATWGITSYDYFRDGQVGGLQGPFVERGKWGFFKKKYCTFRHEGLRQDEQYEAGTRGLESYLSAIHISLRYWPLRCD